MCVKIVRSDCHFSLVDVAPAVGALRWLGHALGVIPASCGTAALCFSGSSQKKVLQRARELSFGSLPKSGPWLLEAGPTRSSSAMDAPSHREISYGATP